MLLYAPSFWHKMKFESKDDDLDFLGAGRGPPELGLEVSLGFKVFESPGLSDLDSVGVMSLDSMRLMVLDSGSKDLEFLTGIVWELCGEVRGPSSLQR